MGAVKYSGTGNGLFVKTPQIFSKEFCESLLEKLHEEGGDQVLVLDFTDTRQIHNNVYPIIHQIRSILKKENGELKSINMSNAVKSQLQSHGTQSMFNIHNIDVMKKPKLKKSIEVGFIKPFIEGTIEILKVQANTIVKSHKPVLKKKGDATEYDIVGLITIISDAFTGSISLCFDKRTFLNICENMLGDTYSEIDEEVEDAAAELLNIIFGKAKTDLNDKSGYNLKKAIPTIIKGPGIRVKQTTQPAIILPFESDAGTFTLEVELSEHGGV